ncbi:Protein phosphatase 1 regulatory subunit SDS22, partial [Lachnellula suecica]
MSSEPEKAEKEKMPLTPKSEEAPHISLKEEDAEGHDATGSTTPKSSSGWDGKLRLEKRAELVNPEAISDAEYSDEEQVLAGESIEADEDLLDDYPTDTTEIDLVHARISSLPSLKLSRFKASLSELAPTLTELDLYDNLIAHIKNLDSLTNLTSLDLSFNKIKHIKHLSALTQLTDLYFVQNKISDIEGLEGLSKLRNLELAANRIREIKNLEHVSALEELWLGKNKITEIKGLSTLQNLKILSIQSNRMRSISGLTSLPHLEELYISHNALTSLSGLEECKGLRVLDISNNQVEKLD